MSQSENIQFYYVLKKVQSAKNLTGSVTFSKDKTVVVKKAAVYQESLTGCVTYSKDNQCTIQDAVCKEPLTGSVTFSKDNHFNN